MNVSSHYLWERTGSVEYNPFSVVLQEVCLRKKESFFACVCESLREGKEAVAESGYFTERLVEWFHKKYLKSLVEHGGGTEIANALQQEIATILKETDRYSRNNGGARLQYSGILIRNNQCFLFQKGNIDIVLLNKRYNKRNMKQLILPEEVAVWEGSIQKHVGVLLCPRRFASTFQEEELLEVLFSEQKVTDEWIEKHLKELWQEGTSRGQMNCCGAVYLRT